MNRFRWWYMEIVQDEELWVLVLYDHPFYLTFPLLLVDVSWYGREGKRHKGIPYPASQLRSTGINQLHWVDGYFLFNGKEGKCYLSHEEMGIDLEIEAFIPADQGIRTIYQGTNDYFLWRPIVAEGKVKGKIHFYGKEHVIDGITYMDYNEGSGNLRKMITSWDWYKVSTNQSVRVQSRIDLHNGETVMIRSSFGESPPDESETGFPDATEFGRQVDQVRFYISSISEKFPFFRKVDEFLFYQPEERWPGNIINRWRSNVVYERYFLRTGTEIRTGEKIAFR